MTIEIKIVVQQTPLGIDMNINASGVGSEVEKKEAQFIHDALATVLSCRADFESINKGSITNAFNRRGYHVH
ncbi:hypothetical protein [Candidatus Sodalis pierantonius]|uniref:hypothetical protein n=1 Tax=Candidatus Sodalis pierantonii TaxID=1486991 RepID=UPI00046CD81A|nr:hypothetical protein [Candidatus Sodalis pierantonius]